MPGLRGGSAVTTAAGADVGQQISAIMAGHRVVDLTLPLAEDLPCTWPGHMPFRATVWNRFTGPDDPQPVRGRSGSGSQTRWLVIDEHAGTHIDAPRHVVPPPGSGLPHAGPAGEVGVDKLPLLAASGPADLVDVTGLAGTAENGVSPLVTVPTLIAWEAAYGPILPGDVVLLRAGWDSRYRSGAAGRRYADDALVTRTEPAWPAPVPEAISWLHDRGVRCVGTDGPSIGPAGDSGPVHLAGLTRGMVFVEALARLAELPPRGAWFLFLPLHLVDGTGAPGRAIAVLPGRLRSA